MWYSRFPVLLKTDEILKLCSSTIIFFGNILVTDLQAVCWVLFYENYFSKLASTGIWTHETDSISQCRYIGTKVCDFNFDRGQWTFFLVWPVHLRYKLMFNNQSIFNWSKQQWQYFWVSANFSTFCQQKINEIQWYQRKWTSNTRKKLKDFRIVGQRSSFD